MTLSLSILYTNYMLCTPLILLSFLTTSTEQTHTTMTVTLQCPLFLSPVLKGRDWGGGRGGDHLKSWCHKFKMIAHVRTFESVYCNVGNQCVKFVNWIFIFVSLSVTSYTNTVRYVPVYHMQTKCGVYIAIKNCCSPDSPCPHCLVEFCVNPDIRGLHLLFCKLLDSLDGPRGTSLEASERNDNYGRVLFNWNKVVHDSLEASGVYHY